MPGLDFPMNLVGKKGVLINNESTISKVVIFSLSLVGGHTKKATITGFHSLTISAIHSHLQGVGLSGNFVI